MGRPKRDYPVARISTRKKNHTIYWSHARTIYEFSSSQFPSEKLEDLCYMVNHGLRTGDWPDAFLSVSAVQRYISATAAVTDANQHEVMARYAVHLDANTSPQEKQMEMQRLRDFADTGVIPYAATGHDVASFLSSIERHRGFRYRAHWIKYVLADGAKNIPEIIVAMSAAGCPDALLAHDDVMRSVAQCKSIEPVPGPQFIDGQRVLRKYVLKDGGGSGRSALTRNRYLGTLNRFYAWCKSIGIRKDHPSEDLRRKREQDFGNIAYFDADGRDKILRVADELFSENDALAVWIAMYAGLRCSEIWNLRWDRVDLDLRWLRIRGDTKNKKHRDVPIHKALLKRLVSAEKVKTDSRVVCWPEDVRRYKIYTSAMVRDMRKVIQAPDPRWNTFRHTFCSQLAQAGVSIDQIAAIAGHTPDVCRRHYASLVSSDAAKTGIDLI